MNLAAQAYRINTPRIIHETLDRETVIIDTETGVYFVLGGSGPLLWAALEEGAAVQALADHLGQQNGADAGALLSTVSAFLAELQAEQLIVEAPASVPRPAVGGASAPFAPPTLQKFTDMEALLLIDPIHEVEDSGWPHQRSRAAS